MTVQKCWWCGKPITDWSPRNYYMHGYRCYMHALCATSASDAQMAYYKRGVR